MGQSGDRSKSTDLWLAPSDEDRFADAVGDVLPGAAWRCGHAGPIDRQPKHLHPTVADAMACGGVHAFLPLPIGADPFTGESKAMVQLLRSEIRDDEDGRYFRGGRVATRWCEHEVGPDLHMLLSTQRDVVWQALRRTTAPAHLHRLDGGTVSGTRIGPTALDTARAEGLLLGPPAGSVRYRLTG